MEAQQAFGAAEQRAKEELQGKLEREPLPEFIPTKDTAQDIAGLFSLIGVIGMVVGKGNAMQAMGAMNGMLEGHRKGRATCTSNNCLSLTRTLSRCCRTR